MSSSQQRIRGPYREMSYWDAAQKIPGHQYALKGQAHRSAKLTETDVRAIRTEYIPFKNGAYRLGRKFGVKPHTIHAIISGHTWRSVA